MYFWEIKGYDSFYSIFEKKINYSALSVNQLKNLLKALTANNSLNKEEIFCAYLNKKNKLRNDLLEIHFDQSTRTYFCGSNPHFLARIIENKTN